MVIKPTQNFYCIEQIVGFVTLFIFSPLSDHKKEDNRIIQKKTKQLVDIVEQRNALVELLDEERKRWVESPLLHIHCLAPSLSDRFKT